MLLENVQLDKLLSVEQEVWQPASAEAKVSRLKEFTNMAALWCQHIMRFVRNAACYTGFRDVIAIGKNPCESLSRHLTGCTFRIPTSSASCRTLSVLQLPTSLRERLHLPFTTIQAQGVFNERFHLFR